MALASHSEGFEPRQPQLQHVSHGAMAMAFWGWPGVIDGYYHDRNFHNLGYNIT